jgi:hypothetical protein
MRIGGWHFAFGKYNFLLYSQLEQETYKKPWIIFRHEYGV